MGVLVEVSLVRVLRRSNVSVQLDLSTSVVTDPGTRNMRFSSRSS
jgi:hypothetical protein